jgi:hypothetical protein
MSPFFSHKKGYNHPRSSNTVHSHLRQWPDESFQNPTRHNHLSCLHFSSTGGENGALTCCWLAFWVALRLIWTRADCLWGSRYNSISPFLQRHTSSFRIAKLDEQSFLPYPPPPIGPYNTGMSADSWELTTRNWCPDSRSLYMIVYRIYVVRLVMNPVCTRVLHTYHWSSTRSLHKGRFELFRQSINAFLKL